MLKRPLWLATGVAVGVGGTLWAEQRIRRATKDLSARLAPDHAVRSAARATVGLSDRLRAAGDAVQQERLRHERELRGRWSGLGVTPITRAAPTRTGGNGARP
jgi:hypothetical protein